eukprot:gene20938-25118_t
MDEHEVTLRKEAAVGIVLVMKEGALRLEYNNLIDHIKDKLGPPKWPYTIVYMTEVPR